MKPAGVVRGARYRRRRVKQFGALLAAGQLCVCGATHAFDVAAKCRAEMRGAAPGLGSWESNGQGVDHILLEGRKVLVDILVPLHRGNLREDALQGGPTQVSEHRVAIIRGPPSPNTLAREVMEGNPSTEGMVVIPGLPPIESRKDL